VYAISIRRGQTAWVVADALLEFTVPPGGAEITGIRIEWAFAPQLAAKAGAASSLTLTLGDNVIFGPEVLGDPDKARDFARAFWTAWAGAQRGRQGFP
jgi:hypothetical protein